MYTRSRARPGRLPGVRTLGWLVVVLMLVMAVVPAAAIAADGDVTIVQDDNTNGCNGVRTTPGSENTDKQLIGGTLEPGGTAMFLITYPVDPEDVAGREEFEITDCVFIEDTAVLKFFISFVPNTDGLRARAHAEHPARCTARGGDLQLREDHRGAVRFAGEQPQGRPGLLHRRRRAARREGRRQRRSARRRRLRHRLHVADHHLVPAGHDPHRRRRHRDDQLGLRRQLPPRSVTTGV